jgi:PKD repeat protein
MKSNTLKFFRRFLSLGLLAIVLLAFGCDHYDETPDPTTLTADFNINLSGDCPTPCQVCFTNNSQNATAYTWDFGNGQTSTEQNPCVIYQSSGTYTVTLITSNGTGTQTTTKTVIVGDNIERYRRTFSANSSGIVTNLLIHNGFTYALMTVDGVKKVLRFNATSELQRDLVLDASVTNMVAADNGSFFLTGASNNNACVAKYTEDMVLNYFKSYANSRGSVANSIVIKNTGDVPGHIVCGALEDNWSYDQGLLINTDELGNLYNPDAVTESVSVNRIFRNAANGHDAYVAIGSRRDPIEQKLDIRVFSVNEQGVDFYTINSYVGSGNGKDDAVYDAIQFNNGSSYAAVGETGGNALFFITNHQTDNFTPPFTVTNFPATVKRLTGVCVLNDGNFVVAGTEYTPDYTGIYLAKISPGGFILWQKRLVPNTISVFGDIVATPDGGMLLGGQELCAGGTCLLPVLYKMDTNGDFQ